MTAFDTAWVLMKAPIVYHGGSNWEDEPKFPLFFTEDKEGAEWYALEHGDETPTIHEAQLDFKKPATLDDLLNAAKGIVNRDDETYGYPVYDLGDYSPYDGTNPLDLAYHPKVREVLMNRGFDGISTMDPLTNTEIPVHVALDDSTFNMLSRTPVDLEEYERRLAI